MLEPLIFCFPEAYTMFAGAGAAALQGIVDDFMINFFAFFYFIVILLIHQQQNVIVTIPDMADNRAFNRRGINQLASV